MITKSRDRDNVLGWNYMARECELDVNDGDEQCKRLWMFLKEGHNSEASEGERKAVEYIYKKDKICSQTSVPKKGRGISARPPKRPPWSLRFPTSSYFCFLVSSSCYRYEGTSRHHANLQYHLHIVQHHNGKGLSLFWSPSTWAKHSRKSWISLSSLASHRYIIMNLSMESGASSNPSFRGEPAVNAAIHHHKICTHSARFNRIFL